MSSVTTSGSSACICRSASSPLRAVPTTRNSDDEATMSLTTLRMKALSSTTRTVRAAGATAGPPELDDTRAPLERAHDHRAVGDAQVDAPPVVPPGVPRDHRHAGGGERGARGLHVPLAHVDAAGGQQLREHA